MSICNELRKRRASIFKLLICDAILCIILNCLAPDTNQVVMCGYIALKPTKGLSPKPSFLRKSPYTIVQCVNDVTHKVKNTVNQKQTFVVYERSKPLIQRPVELELPLRGPRLPRESKSKPIQKPHSGSPNCLSSLLFSRFCPRKSHPRIFYCCMSKTSILVSKQNHSM